MNGDEFNFGPLAVAFVLCVLAGAVIGAAITGLFWWWS